MGGNEMQFPEPAVEVPPVDPETVKRRLDETDRVVLLDVRMPEAYQRWHIEGDVVESIHVPYDRFTGDTVEEAVLDRIPADEHVTVVCAKGLASEFVAGELAARGYDVDHMAEGMTGWSRLYEAHEVTGYDGPGTLTQYQRPSSGCLAYLLVDGTEAAVVDPLRAFTDRYLADAADRGVELRYAFDTHIHADHVSGLRELAAVGVEAVLPQRAADRGVTYADAVTLAADGDTFDVGDATIEAVATPGHTTGMTSYLLGGSFLATGDGLFIESVARPDLESGDAGAPAAAHTLYDSLQDRVLTFDDDVLVGGAHASAAAEPAPDGTFTAPIGELRERMDTLSLDREAFVERVLANMPPQPANYETIIATNLGTHTADDEEAFTLELGPNNCAASTDALTSGD